MDIGPNSFLKYVFYIPIHFITRFSINWWDKISFDMRKDVDENLIHQLCDERITKKKRPKQKVKLIKAKGANEEMYYLGSVSYRFKVVAVRFEEISSSHTQNSLFIPYSHRFSYLKISFFLSVLKLLYQLGTNAFNNNNARSQRRHVGKVLNFKSDSESMRKIV